MTRKLMLAVVLTMLPVIGRASNFTLQGNFTADDNVQLFSVSLATPAAVDFRSYGYAGGTTSTGTVAPRGGFDTILTLFSASGVFIDDNDDGAGVATDPVTGLAGDARITTNLTAGGYILALTQYDNFSGGNLADGFVEAGNPNFTANPAFASGGPCPGNMFRDISGTAGRCRSGNWTVDFVNVGSVTPAAPVPEPSAWLLTGAGLAVLLLARRRRPRKMLVLELAVIAVLVSVPAHAQTKSGTDYSTVNDFLQGKRSVLDVTDIAIFNSRGIPTVITTSNSNQTLASTFTVPGSLDETKTARIFPARMFNQVAESTLTPLYDYNHSALLTFLIQSVANVPNKVLYWQPFQAGYEPNVSGGVAADFNGDGYDEMAVGFANGVMLIATANDVNDQSKSVRQKISNLDVLSDMTAGDFKGDGGREIAGLTISNGGLKLVIYAVDPQTLTATTISSLTLTSPGASPGAPITLASIARGRFSSAGHDQLAVGFTTAAGPAYVEVIDFTPGTLTPHEASPALGSPAGNIAFPYGYMQVKTGQFGLPNNQYDQIVYHSSSPQAGGRFFEILTVDPTNFAIGGTGPVTYDQYPCAFGVQVGNFDHRQSDSSTGGQTQPDLNNQVAFLYCTGGTSDNPNVITNTMMNIYSVDPVTLNLQGNPDSALDLGYSGQIRAGSSEDFVAADLQGRSLVLGEPLIVDLSNRDQPSVVVAVPPMHVDFVSPDPVDGVPPTVLNLSAVPDGFTNTYENSTSDAHPHQDSQKTSWSWGAKESINATGTIGDVESSGYQVGDKFTAAQKLKGSIDTINGSFQSYNFGLTATSVLDDVVEHKENNLRIWVYPVIGQTVCPKGKTCPPDAMVPLTIQFSAPTNNNAPQDSNGASLSWYQPPWEPGNVFSYPANLTQLQNVYPGQGSCPSLNGPIQQTNTALCTLAVGNGFSTDNNVILESSTWSVTSTTGTDASFNQNYSFENDLSVTGAVGVKGAAQATFGYEGELSGSFGFSHVTNDSTTLGTSTGLSVNKPGTFLSPDTNYEYQVTPYIFGTVVSGGDVDNQPLSTNVQTFGLIRAVFTADPLNSGHWWGQAYNQAPDVALNHPERWKIVRSSVPSGDFPSNCLATSTKGGSSADCAEVNDRLANNPWLSAYHQMRGLFISSANAPGQGPQLEQAKAGDVLALQARVYNYSLKPMDSNTEVHVRFYFTPWNGTAAAGPSVLINEVVTNPIPQFSDIEGKPPNWVLVPTTFDTSKFQETRDGDVNLVFWVVVWTQDSSKNLLKEMPGHGLTAIPPAGAIDPVTQETTTQFATVAGFEECQPTKADGTTPCYSNNLGFYPQIFYIASNSLGAAPGSATAKVDISKVEVSANQVTPRDNLVLSATLSAKGDAASGVSVNFYDGDPDEGGRSFAVVRIPHMAEDSPYRVQTLFRSNTCGVHQLFAVVNRAPSSEVVRRVHPVRVACNAHSELGGALSGTGRWEAIR